MVKLRAWFADRLRRDHAAGFAHLNHAAGAKVAAVAERADAAPGFAGKHRANLDLLDAGALDRRGGLFVDLAGSHR